MSAAADRARRWRRLRTARGLCHGTGCRRLTNGFLCPGCRRSRADVVRARARLYRVLQKVERLWALGGIRRESPAPYSSPPPIDVSEQNTRSSRTVPADPRVLLYLLTEARQRRGWSLKRLSVEAGVPFCTVRRLSTGRIGLGTALKLAAALDCQFWLQPVLTAQQAQGRQPA